MEEASSLLIDSPDSTVSNIVAALVMFMIGVIGIVFDVIGATFVFRCKNLQNAFGYLCAFHLLADAGILLVYVFCAVPATQMDHNATFNFTRYGGIVALFFWFCVLYAQLMIAINRAVALCFPLQYNNLFQKSNVVGIVALAVFISLCHCIVYVSDTCSFFFDSYFYYWVYSDSPCGRFVSYWLDFSYGVFILTLVLLLDGAAFVKLRIRTTLSSSNHLCQRRKREKRFLIQALLTAILFSFMLFSFHVATNWFTEKWWKFFTTSVVWELTHLGDGLIMLFNKDFRHAVLHSKLLLPRNTDITSSGIQQRWKGSVKVAVLTRSNENIIVKSRN